MRSFSKVALSFAAIAVACSAAATAAVAQDPPRAWSSADVSKLKQWVDAAPQDALPVVETRDLDWALARGDTDEVSEQARQVALRLATMHLKGRTGETQRRGWNIHDTDDEDALGPMLDNALSSGSLDTFFTMQRPVHPEYSALRAAYATERDEQRRTGIARNMERWRWLPRSLGQDYVLVNTARFEAYLWRGGVQAGTWRVIVGKTSTPTPVFGATITGVIYNPWWEIPASIVRESVGALVRRNPALARQRGYVWSGGHYRQRPGPNNALGQMKLVMPNPYSVFMHDTPNKTLFEKEARALSHGCIRTGDAIGYASKLLEGVRSREEVDLIVAGGETTQVNLASPLPLYVTYFTAVDDGQGGIAILDDIYGRDRRIKSLLFADYLGQERQDSVGCNMQMTG